MLKNTQERWGSIAKAFHWTIAAMILLEVPVGYLMTYTYGLMFKAKSVEPLQTLTDQIHHTNGLLILLLVITRFGWRMSNPKVEAVAGVAPLQDKAANGVHFAIYALLLIIPLSGWASMSALGIAPIWFFNLKNVVPHILPTQPMHATYGYGFFARIHVWGIWAGGVLLSIHVLAALWHHFVKHDDVLVRMWPLGRAHNRPES